MIFVRSYIGIEDEIFKVDAWLVVIAHSQELPKILSGFTLNDTFVYY